MKRKKKKGMNAGLMAWMAKRKAAKKGKTSKAPKPLKSPKAAKPKKPRGRKKRRTASREVIGPGGTTNSSGIYTPPSTWRQRKKIYKDNATQGTNSTVRILY